MKIKLTKLLLCIFFIIILSLNVNAISKPIAGIINFSDSIETTEVNIYVEIESPFQDGTEICKINPTIESGEDGSFSSNLDNLVFSNFPSMDCNGFWQTGNNIWYDISYNEETFTSENETIESGTGLQYLSSTLIEQEEESSPDPGNPPSSSSSSSSSSGGGGGSSSSDHVKDYEKVKDNESTQEEFSSIDSPINQDSYQIPSKSNIKANLSIDLIDNPNFAELSIQNLSLNLNYTSYLIIFQPPENKIIMKMDYFISNQEQYNTTFLFNSTSLEDGWYRIRSFTYLEEHNSETLASISNGEEFYIKTNFIEVEEERVFFRIETPTQMNKISLTLYITSIIIIIVAIILIILKRRENRDF